MILSGKPKEKKPKAAKAKAPAKGKGKGKAKAKKKEEEEPAEPATAEPEQPPKEPTPEPEPEPPKEPTPKPSSPEESARVRRVFFWSELYIKHILWFETWEYSQILQTGYQHFAFEKKINQLKVNVLVMQNTKFSEHHDKKYNKCISI